MKKGRRSTRILRMNSYSYYLVECGERKDSPQACFMGNPGWALRSVMKNEENANNKLRTA